MPFPFAAIRSPAIFCFLWLVLAAVLQAQAPPDKPQHFHIHEGSSGRRSWPYEYNTYAFRTGFQKLFVELKALTRRTESRIGYVRPDLPCSTTNGLPILH